MVGQLVDDRKQSCSEIPHGAIVHEPHEGRGGFRQRLGVSPHPRELFQGARLVHHVQRGGEEKALDAGGQRAHLLGRYQLACHRQEHHGDAVVVGRVDLHVLRAEYHAASTGGVEITQHLAGRQVVHDAGKVAMAAEGHDEGQAIADAVAAAGDDREAAGEADTQHADAPIRGQLRLIGCPADGIFDDIGDRRRDPEPLQVRSGDGEYRKPRRDEILRQAHEARFVDAVAMHARHEDDRAVEAA